MMRPAVKESVAPLISYSCPIDSAYRIKGLDFASHAIGLEIFHGTHDLLQAFYSGLQREISACVTPATTGPNEELRYSSDRRNNMTSRTLDHPLIDQLEQELSELYRLMGYRRVGFYEIGVYKQGEYFRRHYDYLEEKPTSRARTILVYFSDLSLGGELFFPLIDLMLPPLNGLIVSWSNINGNGKLSFPTLHESTVLVNGTKVVLTFFASL